MTDREDALRLGSRLAVNKRSINSGTVWALKEEFTLREETSDFSYGPGKVLTAWEEDRHWLYIPRASERAWDMTDRYPYRDDRSAGEKVGLPWRGQFREGQQEFIDEMVREIRDCGESVGQAGCGFGKTVCGTAIASRLGRTVLVGTHKKALVKQWVKAFKQFWGVDAGIVQGKTCDYEGRQVVVAMVQSLDQIDYPEGLYKFPGLTIWDECHRMGAPTFANAITKFPSRYRLGLTATPRRGDKMEDLFFWHLGQIGARGIGEYLDCEVYGLKTKFEIPTSQCFVRGKLNLSKLITALCELPERTGMIVDCALRAVRSGRKVLLLTHRRSHAEQITSDLEMHLRREGGKYTVGNFASSATKKGSEAQDAAALCDLTVSTWPMAAEGLDIPCKDTLICCTPKGDMEQAAGRIRRVFKGKKDPMIIDFIDAMGICWGLWGKRTEFYESTSLDKGKWVIKMVQR